MPKAMNEGQFLKLRGKYFKNTITPQELKRFMELTMTRNNHVGMKEIASIVRNNANK